MDLPGQFGSEVGICDGRTNRVGVRIFVTDHIDFIIDYTLFHSCFPS